MGQELTSYALTNLASVLRAVRAARTLDHHTCIQNDIAESAIWLDENKAELKAEARALREAPSAG